MRLLAAVLVVVASAVVNGSFASDYPDRPIRLVVPYPAGAGTDGSARIVAEALSRQIGQQIVVENRPGASGTIGVDHVARSAADGYTLLWTSTDSITTVPALMGAKVPYRIPDDLSFIGKVCETGMALVVSTKLPAKSVPEFIAYGKSHPGKLSYGTSGVGGLPHLATLLFGKYAGVTMTHVPYKGVAPALSDLLGGQIDFALLTPITIASQLGSDRMRVIGITAPTRHPMLPDAPTFKELGLPQATATVWYGMFAPKGLPAPVLAKLRSDVEAVSRNPAVREKLETAGLQMNAVAGDVFEKSIAAEMDQWRAIIKEANIVVE